MADEELEEDVEFEGDDEPEFDEDAIDEETIDEGDEFGLADDDAIEAEAEDDDDADDRGPARTRAAAAEEEDDDEDLVNEDDVEADLDTILKDRLVSSEDEAAEDEDEAEIDDRGDPVDRIATKRPGEFVCQSCFLLKTNNQLADPAAQLCRDCV